jgi:SAM-dependent methyltransferase
MTMLDYYARRAGEYERVYAKPERQGELRTLERSLAPAFAGRRVLEVACGTGWWTPHGARDARDWLATDANESVLAVAQAKPGLPACVRFARADAYALPGECFDAAFAGFWWSHVPRERLRGWLAGLHARLERGARIVFIDNVFAPGSSTPIVRRDAAGNSYQQRRLDDGSTHEVLKNFPTCEEAVEAIGPDVRDAQWSATDHYWRLDYSLA